MKKDEITIDHPKLHKALTTYMQMLALDSSFKTSKSMHDKLLRMRLHFNDGDTCYTNFNAIFLGLNASRLQGKNLDELYHNAKTIIGHEVGHIRLTDSRDWNKFVYSSSRIYGQLAGFAKDILNILEDSRIERIMGEVSSYLQKNFFINGYKHVKKYIPEIKEYLKKGEPLTAEKKLVFIGNLIHYISYTRILPKINNEEITNYMKKCYPFILMAKETDSTEKVGKAAAKILDILNPLMQDFASVEGFKIEPKFSFKDVGSHDPTEPSEIMDESSKSGPFSLPKELEEMLKKVADEAAKDIEEDEEESEEKKAPSVKDTPDVNFEDETEDFDFDEWVEDIASRLDDFDTDTDDIDEAAGKLESQFRKPITGQLLGDLLKNGKKNSSQKVRERKQDLKIKKLEPRINVPLHKDCQAVFQERDKMRSFSRNEYDQIVQQMNPVIRKAVTSIREVSQMAVEETLRNQRTGRLDRKNITNYLAFDDTDIFKTKEVDKKQLTMEVMLLVDVSGSNMSPMLNEKNDERIQRYKMNQSVSIMLHEILKRLRFNHSVWSFYEASLSAQMFSTMVHNQNCFDKDSGLFLNEIGAYANNRDGYSIRYAGEYLNRFSTSDNRLLIVLSDGQPAAAGYHGQKAIEDVKKAVNDVKKGGSKVVGIFTGHEQENDYFKMMYDNHIFCNNESIFDLPNIMKKLLVTEFQDYVSKVI